MAYRNLEEKLQAAGSAVEMARNSQIGPYVYPAVPSEFSNWMDEQVAWRETAALFDQTHHMTDLYVEGPDVVKLFSDLGVNTFANFQADKAKQFVACNHDGYVIGDAILFFLDENRVSLVGRPSAHNWVQFHAETGDYDVSVERDERTAANPTGRRKIYRFQVQGPTALDVLTKANGGVAARDQVLQHGRAHDRGPQGARAPPRHVGRARARALRARGTRWRTCAAAIVEAGEDFGLRQVGSRVYATNTLESGLDPVPAAGDLHGRRAEGVPRVAPGRRLRGHGLARRQLLRRRHLRLLRDAARSRLLAVREVRPRLRRTRGARGDGRRAGAAKVTLAWNGEDVASAMGTLFEKGDAAKYINLPLSNYATWPHDKLLHDGEIVGVSTFSGYSYNERSMLSLGYVDVDVPIGAELVTGVGRGGRRVDQAGRRAAPAGGDPRRREPVPLLGGRAHVVPRGLALEGRGVA